MSELEQSPDDRLSLHQNKTTTLQGQIDIMKTHQMSQDKRINFAIAREAEESDGRINERFCVSLFVFWVYQYFFFSIPICCWYRLVILHFCPSGTLI